MKNEVKIRRKLSALVALVLAVMVTFVAALDSYGDASTDPLLSIEFKDSMFRAYEEVTADQSYFEVPEENVQIIKIYSAENELVSSYELGEGDVIEDNDVKKLLNRSDFLTSYKNTMVYRLCH